MKELDFELIPVSKEEYEEDVERAKRKRGGIRRNRSLFVDPLEQKYNWEKFGHRLVVVNGKVITEYRDRV